MWNGRAVKAERHEKQVQTGCYDETGAQKPIWVLTRPSLDDSLPGCVDGNMFLKN